MNDLFYARKWEAIACIRSTKNESEAMSAYLSTRAEALEARSWETLRELDREMALRTRDESLYRQLYFGSPYPSYRSRLEEAWGSSIGRNDSLEFIIGDKTHAALGADIVDLSTGRFGEVSLNAAKVLHRILFTLAADFYRPQTSASLFQVLHPKEIYHPEFGKKRVHQTLFLLRRKIAEIGIPLVVEESSGLYRLQGAPACRVRVPAWSPWETQHWRMDVAKEALFRRGGENEFSSADASGWMGTSHRTTLRILAEGVREGWLLRRGNRNAVRYRMTPPGGDVPK
jgi:hypothetical protein